MVTVRSGAHTSVSTRSSTLPDTSSSSMARDSPEPGTTVVRRKRTGAAGGKETKVRQSRKAETVSQDIQEELTEKLETLLERDRPEVRIVTISSFFYSCK